jgi:hypothetical protein
VSLQDGGRAPEHADFAASQVDGRRRRPSMALLGWVAVLVGVVGLGLSGRSGDTAAGPLAATDSSTAVPRPSAESTVAPPPTRSVVPPRFEPDGFPIATGAPGPIQIQATREPSTVYVHGDVFAQQVTSVFVGLQSLDGQVGGWASVVIPGAAGDGRDHRPALRFDVELAVPTGLATGVLVVRANAYNADGRLVGSTNVRLEPQM